MAKYSVNTTPCPFASSFVALINGKISAAGFRSVNPTPPYSGAAFTFATDFILAGLTVPKYIRVAYRAPGGAYRYKMVNVPANLR